MIEGRERKGSILSKIRDKRCFSSRFVGVQLRAWKSGLGPLSVCHPSPNQNSLLSRQNLRNVLNKDYHFIHFNSIKPLINIFSIMQCVGFVRSECLCSLFVQSIFQEEISVLYEKGKVVSQKSKSLSLRKALL